MKTLDEYIEYLDCTIRMHEDLRADIKAEATRKGLSVAIGENIQLRDWLVDYRMLKAQQKERWRNDYRRNGESAEI